jgi:hypothetical protein
MNVSRAFRIARPEADSHRPPDMFPQLDTPFSKEIRDEALGYELDLEPYEDFPDGLDSERIGQLYELALAGSPRAVTELKPLIEKFPQVPVLRNFLSVAYHQLKKPREARKVDEETLRVHPGYFFARLSKGTRLLEAGKSEEAREWLGDLRLSGFEPGSRRLHHSHWQHFYALVTEWYIAEEMFEEAEGVIQALARKRASESILTTLRGRLQLKRIEFLQLRIKRDQAREILVKPPDIPKMKSDPGGPDFHHEEIHALYEFGPDLPKQVVDLTHALPRDTVVADLEAVIEDAIARGPWFIRSPEGEESTWFALHALFLLGELGATGSIGVVLRFLEQHPDLLDFWFGDSVSWQPFLPLVGPHLPLLAEWMRKPGVSSRGKDSIAEAVGQTALHDPARREEVVAWVDGLIEFFLTCPAKTNVLDTRVVTALVCVAMDLQATALLPRIEALFAKDYVSEMMVGGLPDVQAEFASGPAPWKKKERLPMLEFYRELSAPEATGGGPLDAAKDYRELFGPVAAAASPTTGSREIGRNDPCPCGSGKKHKKCCL